MAEEAIDLTDILASDDSADVELGDILGAPDPIIISHEPEQVSKTFNATMRPSTISEEYPNIYRGARMGGGLLGTIGGGVVGGGIPGAVAGGIGGELGVEALATNIDQLFSSEASRQNNPELFSVPSRLKNAAPSTVMGNLVGGAAMGPGAQMLKNQMGSSMSEMAQGMMGQLMPNGLMEMAKKKIALAFKPAEKDLALGGGVKGIEQTIDEAVDMGILSAEKPTYSAFEKDAVEKVGGKIREGGKMVKYEGTLGPQLAITARKIDANPNTSVSLNEIKETLLHGTDSTNPLGGTRFIKEYHKGTELGNNIDDIVLSEVEEMALPYTAKERAMLEPLQRKMTSLQGRLEKLRSEPGVRFYRAKELAKLEEEEAKLASKMVPLQEAINNPTIPFSELWALSKSRYQEARTSFGKKYTNLTDGAEISNNFAESMKDLVALKAGLDQEWGPAFLELKRTFSVYKDLQNKLGGKAAKARLEEVIPEAPRVTTQFKPIPLLGRVPGVGRFAAYPVKVERKATGAEFFKEGIRDLNNAQISPPGRMFQVRPWEKASAYIGSRLLAEEPISRKSVDFKPQMDMFATKLQEILGPEEAQAAMMEISGAANDGDDEKLAAVLAGFSKAYPDVARQVFEPSLSGAASEFNGIVIDPEERELLNSNATIALKEKKMNSLEYAEFVSRLNLTGEVKGLPSSMRKKRN